MAAKKTDINKYNPTTLDNFFFDNNIWMYLFCPLGNYNSKRQKYYSLFLQNVKSNKSTIFINSMVISEFANRYLRMDFEQWKNETKKYTADFKKDYVGSKRYTETVEEIRIQINQILKCCEKAPDNFHVIDIANIFEHFKYIDFNDSYYLELASRSKWKIVTDDNDFINYQKHNVEILTILE